MIKMKKTKKQFIVLISVVIGMFGIAYILSLFESNKKSRLLKNYSTTWAIYESDVVGVGAAGSHYKFHNVDNKEVTFVDKTFKGIQIGDTVWIKYSNEDNTVAEVLDIDYRKYYKSYNP